TTSGCSSTGGAPTRYFRSSWRPAASSRRAGSLPVRLPAQVQGSPPGDVARLGPRPRPRQGDGGLRGGGRALPLRGGGIGRGEGGPKLGDRLIAFSHHAQGEAQVVVGLGVVRLDAEGLAEMAHRLAQLALRAQDAAQAVVGRGEARVDGEGAAIMADRFVEL